ncbi:MAG: hypothetical protein ABF888_03125 [Acetobacter papayae]
MTPDHLFFMMLGAAISSAGSIALALVMHWRASRGGFWAQATRDDE